ncbi:hypothetical protein RJG79_06450 [Mycoplasmatota bacterium WC44]
MKKLFSLLAALALVLTLAACGDTKIEYVEVEVPVDVIKIETEYVEVEVPVPVETIVEVVVTETVTVVEEVPADVENERFYKPGVYFTNTEVSTDGTYTYAVVVVDAYGKIAGIMFDDTTSTSEFLTNEAGDLYVYVEGDGKTVPNTYRAIAADIEIAKYPTAADAINADDLVVGIHQAEIAELEALEAYETSRVLLGNTGWIKESDKLVKAILDDQSTYGIVTSVSGDEVTAVNVDTNLTNVDVLLGLVQGVLDGEAALTEEVTLATTPVNGLYTPGYKFAATERKISSSVYYYTSFVVVDEFGRIAGVFNDATTADKTVEGANATKAILKEAYGMNAEMPWYLQAQAFSKAVVKNQGVDFVEFLEKEEGQKHEYTDQIAGVTIGVEGFVEATTDALTGLPLPTYKEGSYFVAGSGETKHSFMLVNIDVEGKLESIFLDNTQDTAQATVLRDEEWFPVWKFTKEWLNVEEEVKTTEILVYLDGDEYYPLTDIDYNSDAKLDYEYDEEVEFILDEENGVDEMATLEIVPGNYTKQMLNDRYGMNAENNWYAQADTLAAAFVKGGVYGINLTEDGHTDVTGVTFGSVNEYQQLLVEALLQAEVGAKEALYVNNGATGTGVLADGTYFAAAETDTKGQQYFAWMTVANSVIENIFFDSTLVKDGVVTTKVSLGDDYGMATKKDQLEWFEQAAAYANAFIANQDDIVTEVATGYDYEDEGTFGPLDLETLTTPERDFDAIDTAAGISISSAKFEALTEVLVQKALYARVEEQANAVFKAITDMKYSFVDTDGNVTPTTEADDIDLTIGTGFNFTPAWETADDEIIDVLSGDLIWDIQDIDENSSVTMTLTLEHGDFEFNKEYTIDVVTQEYDKSAKLNAATFDLPYATIIDGFGLVLPTTAYDVEWEITTPETTSGVISLGEFSITDVEEDTEFVLTAWIDVEVSGDDDAIGVLDKTDISREFTFTVRDADDAIEDLVESLMPGNILDDVTAAEIMDLTYETNVGGLTIAWSSGDPAAAKVVDVEDKDSNKIGEKLVINRYADESVEVTLTATVSGGAGATKAFRFNLNQKAEATVELEILAGLATVNLDEYINGDQVATSILVPVAELLDVVDSKLVLSETAAVTWSVKDDGSKAIVEFDGSDNLVIKVTPTETVTVTIIAEGAVVIDADDATVLAKETREFEITLFVN